MDWLIELVVIAALAVLTVFIILFVVRKRKKRANISTRLSNPSGVRRKPVPVESSPPVRTTRRSVSSTHLSIRAYECRSSSSNWEAVAKRFYPFVGSLLFFSLLFRTKTVFLLSRQLLYQTVHGHLQQSLLHPYVFENLLDSLPNRRVDLLRHPRCRLQIRPCRLCIEQLLRVLSCSYESSISPHFVDLPKTMKIIYATFSNISLQSS